MTTAAPTPRSADAIVALVRAAFEDATAPYPMAHVEVNGADAVGTDAYPALRDAWPELVEALRSPAADIRMAAAYALAFIVEKAEHAQVALDAAVHAAEMPLERAAMILAAGRLRGSIVQWRTEPAYSWDGVTLTPEAARETAHTIRAALVIAELFVQPRWSRKVKPEIEVVLRSVDAADSHVISAGPWGGGDLGRFATAMLDTCVVMRDRDPVHAVYGAPPSQTDDDGPDIGDADAIGPEERAAMEAHAAAFAAAEAAIANPPLAERDVADPYTQERPERAAAPLVELAGLRDIDWAHLEHAYGKAEGVPAMIDALSSPDAEDRAWAREALDASIHHQGSVYSASAAAVPFLAQLVERTDIEDRAWLLDLLSGLAVYSPAWHLFDELEEAASPAFAEVSAIAPTFVRLLADPDPEIRSHAAYALSFVMPPEGASIAVKRALAMETNRYTRSSLVLVLGYLGRRTKSTADRAVMERYLDDNCMLIATSAAIALAQIDGHACSPRVRALLASAITDVPPVTGPWPWNDGNVAGFARTVRLAILTVDEMLDEAESANTRNDWTSAREYAVKAFGRSFADGMHGVARPWVPRELDDRQRRILRFLAAISPHHEGTPEPQFPMDSATADAAGIPDDVVAVKRLIGDARGPLDREIEGSPAWFAIDQVVGERASLDGLRAAFASIAAGERVAMLEDAISGPFQLYHCRQPMSFSDATHYQRANDYTSRFIIVIAALLGDAELVGHAYARTMADEEVAQPHPRAMRCLIAAIALAARARANGEEPPAIVDRLVLTEQAPVATHRIAIRAVLDLLAPERQRRLLGDLPLYSYWAHRDPRGEARRWQNERGWDLLDLLEPAACAAKIRTAWREWQRHRAAGDDVTAQPVVGTSSSTMERNPGAEHEFPRDRAIELLVACGDLDRELLDELRG